MVFPCCQGIKLDVTDSKNVEEVVKVDLLAKNRPKKIPKRLYITPLNGLIKGNWVFFSPISETDLGGGNSNISYVQPEV